MRFVITTTTPILFSVNSLRAFCVRGLICSGTSSHCYTTSFHFVLFHFHVLCHLIHHYGSCHFLCHSLNSEPQIVFAFFSIPSCLLRDDADRKSVSRRNGVRDSTSQIRRRVSMRLRIQAAGIEMNWITKGF